MAYYSNFAAIYDANVLYSSSLRDLLMRLAMTGLFRAKWTDAIHEEWIRSLLRDRPDLTRQQLERVKKLMNDHVQDSIVEGYEDFIPSINGLPDPDDRHVVAAAIVGQASVIVTCNLRDFPSNALEKYGIEAQHPDDFICNLIDLDVSAVCKAARKQRVALKNPPKNIGEYLSTLAQQNLPQTVLALQKHSNLL